MNDFQTLEKWSVLNESYIIERDQVNDFSITLYFSYLVFVKLLLSPEIDRKTGVYTIAGFP